MLGNLQINITHHVSVGFWRLNLQNMGLPSNFLYEFFLIERFVRNGIQRKLWLFKQGKTDKTEFGGAKSSDDPAIFTSTPITTRPQLPQALTKVARHAQRTEGSHTLLRSL
jgi:hypothetical protein